MLCLLGRIRDDAPSWQLLLRAVEDAHTLTELLLAMWPVARVMAIHLVESVLAERAQRPTSWPRCPACGALLESKGFVKRQVISLFGPIRWRRRVGRVPRAVPLGRWPPWMRSWACSRISAAVVSCSGWAALWPSLCRLLRQRHCWAGPAGQRSAHRRCGGGCRRPEVGPWRNSRRNWTPCPEGSSRLRSRLRRS
jgi:hypothetical protein